MVITTNLLRVPGPWDGSEMCRTEEIRGVVGV